MSEEDHTQCGGANFDLKPCSMTEECKGHSKDMSLSSSAARSNPLPHSRIDDHGLELMDRLQCRLSVFPGEFEMLLVIRIRLESRGPGKSKTEIYLGTEEGDKVPMRTRAQLFKFTIHGSLYYYAFRHLIASNRKLDRS